MMEVTLWCQHPAQREEARQVPQGVIKRKKMIDDVDRNVDVLAVVVVADEDVRRLELGRAKKRKARREKMLLPSDVARVL